MAFLACVLAVAACSSDESLERGSVGYVEGFLGGAVADEPRAALVGRDVLSAGGSAADAAVAMGFTLAVTLPSSAGLGGGGVCLSFDRRTGRTQALDFLPRAPQAASGEARRPTAVPGLARGLFALHSKSGRLRWGQLVAPAENLARFGEPVSRALARDMAPLGDALAREPDLRRLFTGADGKVLKEGDRLIQLDLSGILGQIRSQGPGDFYAGALARRLAEGATRAGGSLSVDDLRDYRPKWEPTVTVSLGNETAHFAPPPAAAGVVEAQMMALLEDEGGFDDADEAGRAHRLAQAGLRAFGDRARWMGPGGASSVPAKDLTAPQRLDALAKGMGESRHAAPAALGLAPVAGPENPAATGYVVVDRAGDAVACVLTLNNAFGTGLVAEGTGVILAARPGRAGRGPLSLGPMVVVNENVNEFYFAGAASGGLAAPTALVSVAARNLLADQSLEAAMAAPRVHHGGAPDTLFHEAELPPAARDDLAARGHALAATGPLGLVNVLSCAQGIPPHPESCDARSDPRGFGLAATADQ